MSRACLCWQSNGGPRVGKWPVPPLTPLPSLLPQFDPGNTGFISTGKFRSLLENHSSSLDPHKREVLLALADSHADGQICYQDFASLVSARRWEGPVPGQRDLLAQSFEKGGPPQMSVFCLWVLGPAVASPSPSTLSHCGSRVAAMVPTLTPSTLSRHKHCQGPGSPPLTTSVWGVIDPSQSVPLGPQSGQCVCGCIKPRLLLVGGGAEAGQADDCCSAVLSCQAKAERPMSPAW